MLSKSNLQEIEMARLIVIWTCLSVTAVGYAEEVKPPKWGVLLPAISLASDYRFNGMSLSNREPVIQGSLHLWRPDGYYAGIWVSEVDFLDGETSIELDSYVGRNFSHGKYETKVELMYSAFDDHGIPGPTYDFFQLKTGVKRKFGDFSLGLAALWSPAGAAGAGTVSHLRSESEYRLNQYVKAIATFGRRWAEKGFDRTYWDVGLTFEWRKVDFDIRYSGTNLSKPECFYTDWCEGGFYTKITLASY